MERSDRTEVWKYRVEHMWWKCQHNKKSKINMAEIFGAFRKQMDGKLELVY